MSEELQELFADLPANLGGHLLLSVAAVAAAVAVGVPLGVFARRRPRLAEAALAVAGVIQTVPTLALLALFLLLTLQIGLKEAFFPAFLALLMYAVLPVLANTVAGLRGIDPALTEAARGLGMSKWQALWRVELPLAAPVIIGGVRTATVLVVGTATLATPVGGKSLGNYIFNGMATLNHTSTLFGCVTAALLAVALDQLVRLLAFAVRRRSRRLALTAAGILVVAVGVGLVEPTSRRLDGGNRVVVASAAFTEQYTLSHAISTKLEGAGFRAERREGMNYGLQHLALQQGEVDCLVAYTGDVWSLLMKKTEVADRDTTLAETTKFLEGEFGVVCLGPLGFQNNYAVAVSGKRPTADRLTTIADLVADARSHPNRRLRVAGDTGVFHQTEWRRLKKKYGLRDEEVETVEMDPSLMYTALAEGQVDAAIAFSSDGRIEPFGLKLLTDPQRAFPKYDALLLLSRRAADKPGVVDALRPLVGAIGQERMEEANRRVDVGKQSPKRAAEWLLGLKREGTP